MPEYKVMPIEKQRKIIQRMIDEQNPSLSTDSLPNAQGISDYWGDYLDEKLTLHENIGLVKKNFPILKLETWTLPEPKYVRWRDENRRAGPDGRDYWMFTKVAVKPHKVVSKGKVYVRGRIQLTLDEGLIGKEAEVEINVYSADLPPLPPPPPDRQRRKKPKDDYYEF